MNRLLRFGASGLTEVSSSLGTKLDVADSMLIEDGRTRSIEAHFDRFRRGVERTHPVELEHLASFFELALKSIPLEGRWFPRLELHGDQPAGARLHVRVREAPEQQGDAVLITHEASDPRVDPTIKGPDLTLGAELRARASLQGADEAVLLDAAGYLIEGALSALVWWRGDTLCAPGDEVRWLDSVTRREVFAIAEQMGLQTRNEHVKPADLVETEVWILSSLQGIRGVTKWIGLGGPLAPPTRVEAFNRRLKLLAAPIR